MGTPANLLPRPRPLRSFAQGGPPSIEGLLDPRLAGTSVHAPPPSELPTSLTALIDLIRGATVGAGDDPNRWLRGGELLAAVPFGNLRSLTGLVKGATRGGFFSRVDDAVARLLPAKGAHPNKVLSVLKSNASAEELSLRKVPEFLASKGNATVMPADLQAHLAKHPAPVPRVKTLSTAAGRTNTYDDFVSQMEQKYGVGYAREQLTEAERDIQSDLWNTVNTQRGARDLQPKYAQYQVPGGEQYRETLLTLPPPERPPGDRVWMDGSPVTAEDLATEHGRAAADRVASYRAGVEPPQLFQSSHFEDPNILVHTRSNARTLPTGERGRFVEEVQSDWHQQGKKQGYAQTLPPLKPEDVAVVRITEGAYPYWESSDLSTGTLITRHPGDYSQEQVLEEAMRIGRRETPGVPDAPFKETWPDLGLKQQLLETAADPQASWLGFTSGQTQAARYDLSKRFSEVHYSGSNLKAYDLDGNEVLSQTGVRAADLPDYLGDEGAAKLLAQPKQGTLQSLTGVDLQVGGEGMEHFYDRLLPKRLEKILKPFGGTVERGGIPTEMKTMDVDVPAFSVRDQGGHMRGIWENRADAEAYLANPPAFIDPTRSTIVPATTVRQRQVPTTDPAWIARLTPEMKARILKEGLPLMTLPLAAWVAARDQPPSDAELFSLSRFAQRALPERRRAP